MRIQRANLEGNCEQGSNQVGRCEPAGAVGPEEKRQFNERRYYRFGLQMGLANLLRNRMRLGLKKTVGKITQPINSYTRFPEYALMEKAIRNFSSTSTIRERLKILDVGSPKCFGLYLAWSTEAEVELTDISPLNLDEYKMIWNAIQSRAKGRAQFALQDARSLQYDTGQFDVVYAMSVLEHIEGDTGDAEGIREMVRVLRPGGLLLLSFPFGKRYVEQRRTGFAHSVKKTEDKSIWFFQRIYNRSAFDVRISPALKGLQIHNEWTIRRKRRLLVRSFRRLGENIQGVLGFVNPLLSRWVNRCSSGISDEIPSSYSEIYAVDDLYGDLVIVASKEID